MLSGNYELAVETCFKASRLADALIIAINFNRYDDNMSSDRHPSALHYTVSINLSDLPIHLSMQQGPVSAYHEALHETLS